MRNKIFYLILALIVSVALFQGCSKEEIADGSSDIVLQDSLENRNGQFSGTYYIGANSFAFPQKNIQIAFNKDSIVSQSFKRSAGLFSDNYTKVLGTLDPSYQNKPARKYDVTITFRDTIYFFPKAWIKDTSAVSFNKIGSINLIPGANKVYQTVRSESKFKYYDTNYKKFKDIYMYQATLDTLQYTMPIPANNTGTIFWLNHKM